MAEFLIHFKTDIFQLFFLISSGFIFNCVIIFLKKPCGKHFTLMVTVNHLAMCAINIRHWELHKNLQKTQFNPCNATINSDHSSTSRGGDTLYQVVSPSDSNQPR